MVAWEGGVLAVWLYVRDSCLLGLCLLAGWTSTSGVTLQHPWLRSLHAVQLCGAGFNALVVPCYWLAGEAAAMPLQCLSCGWQYSLTHTQDCRTRLGSSARPGCVVASLFILAVYLFFWPVYYCWS